MPPSTIERLNHRRRRAGNRNVVVIGGSAGALEALTRLLPGLPTDLQAALFVVIHSRGRKSALADVLGRAAPFPVMEAEDGAAFQHGRAYVAPPDLHLMFDEGRVFLNRGPFENLSRPSIDVLFRSAAVEFGSRVIGVLLSGNLSDGSAGLRAIQRCGGVTVVQDPDDALNPDMPRNALDLIDIDHRAPSSELAGLIATLTAEPAGPSPPIPNDLQLEARMARDIDATIAKEEQLGDLTELTCPECNGAIWEIRDGALVRYRCHTGHAFDAPSFMQAQEEIVERALWSAVRIHEERLAMLRRMAAEARRSNRTATLERWEEHIADHEEYATALRRIIVDQPKPAREKQTRSRRKGR